MKDFAEVCKGVLKSTHKAYTDILILVDPMNEEREEFLIEYVEKIDKAGALLKEVCLLLK